MNGEVVPLPDEPRTAPRPFDFEFELHEFNEMMDAALPGPPSVREIYRAAGRTPTEDDEPETPLAGPGLEHLHCVERDGEGSEKIAFTCKHAGCEAIPDDHDKHETPVGDVYLCWDAESCAAPTPERCAPFARWTGSLTEELKRDVVQSLEADGLTRDEIEQAAIHFTVVDRTESEVARLAELSPLAYDQERKSVAKELGVRPAILDAEVAKLRPPKGETERESLATPAPVPWPEPVEASVVLDELHGYVKRFIFATEHAITAITLWIAYTYIFEIAETSPRLVLTSATKRCGKTRGLEVLGMLCLHALPGSNLSTNSVFRVIDLEHPTFILDEADTLGAHEKNELRGILNSGHTPANAWVIRNVPVGENAWEPKRFSTWCPIAMAAIGRLPDTWEDRSIKIPMRRKSPDVKVERLGRRNVKAREQALQLCRKLARLAADHLETLRNAIPVIPDLGSDRSEDNWEHLLALGDLGGVRWAKGARAAALALSSGENANAPVDGEVLLADIRGLFEERATDRLASGQICEHLATLEGHPWPEYGRARKPISPTQLARLLADFGVKPRTIRLPDDSTPKGYVLSDFAEAFSSYPPNPPISSRHTATSVGGVGQSDDFQAATEGACGGSENSTFPHGEKGCGGVAAENGPNGRDEKISAFEEGPDRVEEAFEPDPEDF